MLFRRRGILMAWLFDPDRQQTIGDKLQIPVAGHVMQTGFTGSGAYSATPDVLVYRSRPEEKDRRLVLFKRNGTSVTSLVDREEIRPDSRLALSPDENTIAMSIGPEWQSDIWTVDVRSGSPRQITKLEGSAWYPAFAPREQPLLAFGFQPRGALTGELRT